MVSVQVKGDLVISQQLAADTIQYRTAASKNTCTEKKETYIVNTMSEKNSKTLILKRDRKRSTSIPKILFYNAGHYSSHSHIYCFTALLLSYKYHYQNMHIK